MNFKNNLFEQITNVNIKADLYHKLYTVNKIGYSVNPRGIPTSIYTNDSISFIINPDQYNQAFCSGYIQTIQESINNLYSNENIQELRQLWNNDYNEFIAVIQEDSIQINQYSYESILEYFINLFNIEEELNEYNFQDITNKNECINAIMILLIKGYKVELEENTQNNYLVLKIKDNSTIEGNLYFTLEKFQTNNKNIILKDMSIKELLKNNNDLNISLYGEATNKIDGYIPFNINI